MIWLIVLFSLLGLVLVAILVVAVLAIRVAAAMTHVERLPLFGHPSELNVVHEDVEFPSLVDQVTLRGWYLPSQTDRRCILFIQGESHHRNSPGIRALELGRDMVGAGFSVLLFDLRARGESGGKRGSAGHKELWDVQGALGYLESRGIPPERVGLIGYSLGAALAIHIAAIEKRIPAIVCDSGFVDTVRYIKEGVLPWHKLPGWFVVPVVLAGRLVFNSRLDAARPVRVVADLAPRPILFIHGTSDRVVSPTESEELHRAAANPHSQLWMVPGAGHVRSYMSQRHEYFERVSEFFDAYLKAE